MGGSPSRPSAGAGAPPLERTALMQCLERPGHLASLRAILQQPTVDVNLGNERGLNALAQVSRPPSVAVQFVGGCGVNPHHTPKHL